MEESKIVPDIVDTIPTKPLTVIYENDKKVNFGEELTPRDVKNPPSVTWQSKPDDFYTLVMIDPDAPSKKDPKFGEVNHWLVVNIKGSDVTTGNVIKEYLGSGPIYGTGLHRYVFLLYQQKGVLEFDEPRTRKLSTAHRRHFKVRTFAEKYKLGEPLAGNFFEAQWEEFVDIRNKILVDV